MSTGPTTSTLHGRLASAALAALALFPFHGAAAQDAGEDVIRVVALNGDDLDEFAPDELLVVYGSRDMMALAADGTVLFDGAASTGAASRPGWYLASGGDVAGVVYEFEPAPPPLDTFTVGNVEAALLGRGGNLGLELYLSGSPNSEALATWIDGGFTVAGTAPGAFTDLSLGARAFNGDTMVFQGRVASEPAAPRFQSSTGGIWRRQGTAAPAPLLLQDQAVPGLPGRTVDSILTVPIVHESGATAFDVLLDNTEPRHALLVYPPPGNPAGPTAALLYAAGETVHDVTFGDLEDGADVPRWAFLATTGGTTRVVDSVRGTVLTDGQVVGGLTVQLDSASRIAVADGGQVLVMARVTTGAGEVEGLWRCVPDEVPVCELMVGQELDDMSGTPRTVEDIWNVHVNEQGRVAVELDLDFFGTTQVIALQDTAGGPYRVAVQQREYFQADRDAYRVVSIQGLKPSKFTLTDPGHDGHQTRFAADGDLVFSATVDTADDSTDRRGVFVLGGVGPNLCDVKAQVRGGHLVLTNDECDAVLTVRVFEGGEYILRPGDGTSVNGKEGEVAMNAPGDLRASMGGGKDRLVIESAYGESDSGRIPGNLVVDMGAGDDDLTVDYVDTGASMTIAMGRDRGSLEKVYLTQAGTGGNLGIACGPTRTLCTVAGMIVGGTTFIQHGGDQGYVVSEGCVYGRATFVGTEDVETFTFRDCILDGPLKVDLRGGILGTVTFTGCEGEDAPLTVTARKSGSVTFRLEDCDLDRGRVSLTTGTLGSKVTLVGTSITDDVQVRTGGVGTDGNTINQLTFQNSFVYGRLKVKGKGNHEFTVTGQAIVGEGIDVRLKGGVFDSCSISTDTTVESGGILLSTKATGGSRIHIDDVQVQDGSLTVKTAGGEDEVTVTDATLAGGAVLKLGPGKDELTMGDLVGSGAIKADGGPDDDTFTYGAGIGNVDGGVTSKKFENGNGPGVPGAE